jgi:hypothetical protein
LYNYIDFSQFKADEMLEYLRKSRTDDPLLSVEEILAKHEAILDEWAEQNLGEIIPEENKFREVVSGETIADRPEMQTILKKIESPKIKAILTVEVQRLSRGDLEDAGRLIKLLRYTNTLVITPTKTYDLKDEYDRDAFERELKRGNEFLEYQKKIMNRGKLLSVSQGNFVNSIPPYGYNKVWIMEGRRKCPTLAINEDEALVVRMIFNMYVNDDMGCVNICHTLDGLGIKPPKGDKWSPNGIKDMLANITYTGKVVWNRRKTLRIVEDSEISKTRPRASLGDYLVYDGKHEAIISEELFNAALAKQGRNHRAKPTTKIRNPLAGILYCRCGRAMSLRIYKSHDGKPRLLCDDQVHCKTGSVLYDEMISYVCDILSKSIADFEIQMKNNEGDSVKLHEKMIKSLEKRLRDIEARELSQWEAQSDPDPSKRMPQAIFKQLNEKLLKEKDEVQEALHNAYMTKPNPVDYETKIAKFKDALEALQNSDVDAAKKNSLLKDCIDRIDYSREKPQRIKNPEKRTKKNGRENGKGRSLKPNPLKTGGSWTTPPVEIEVKLKV